MNAEALAQLKAAAARKKSGFKAPVVKEIKITREQYCAYDMPGTGDEPCSKSSF